METLNYKSPAEKRQGIGSEALLFGLKDEDKIERFEELMAEQLSVYDTINEAIEKMVKVSLLVEFGPGILRKKVAGNMIKTISAGILSDSELRKQSLLIIDRFARLQELNA